MKPAKYVHRICKEDEDVLQEIATETNGVICVDEGYDPVGVEWLLRILREAYILGYERGYEEA